MLLKEGKLTGLDKKIQEKISIPGIIKEHGDTNLATQDGEEMPEEEETQGGEETKEGEEDQDGEEIKEETQAGAVVATKEVAGEEMEEMEETQEDGVKEVEVIQAGVKKVETLAGANKEETLAGEETMAGDYSINSL